MRSSRPIRVLVVDDSPAIRYLIRGSLQENADIQVVAEAEDPYDARLMICQHRPDVMTLDIMMPKMDGLTFLEKIMASIKIPSIIVSSHVSEDAHKNIEILQAGAFHVITKPDLKDESAFLSFRTELIAAIKKASLKSPFRVANQGNPGNRGDLNVDSQGLDKNRPIFIGSSTGGTQALEALFEQFPSSIPPVLVVQHMPADFTKLFASRLDSKFPFCVKEAVHGEVVKADHVYFAPGGFHMEIAPGSSGYHIKLHQEPPLHSVRPAADYLLKSAALHVGKRAIGIILTGMGYDGADGLLELKNCGAMTIAQDEKTSVVYGMPKAAAEKGAADFIVPLHDIGNKVRYLMKKTAI